jgi:hypothetical protein
MTAMSMPYSLQYPQSDVPNEKGSIRILSQI